MAAWTDPEWLAGAHDWIHRRVEERRGRVSGPIEQPHVRWWSTVLRVPTSAGVLWFKANHPISAYEAAVVEVLADIRPDLVPGLVAVDLDKGWMLMADGGDRLREIQERERSLDRWLEVLPRYGELQIAVSGRAENLVMLGAPDRRLATLADDYERLVAGIDGSTAGEPARLKRLVPDVREMCQALDALGIPETIQHDDLHDGQVFVRDGTYLFFDWGDSCVSHPFFSCP